MNQRLGATIAVIRGVPGVVEFFRKGSRDAGLHTIGSFYAEALGLTFEREEHAGLAPHWGVDIGSVHFGIHPPENFKRSAAGQGSVVLTFDVSSLSECQARLERLAAPCIQPPHEEGFGLVASFSDPEGNPFEIVELTYQFEDGGASACS